MLSIETAYPAPGPHVNPFAPPEVALALPTDKKEQRRLQTEVHLNVARVVRRLERRVQALLAGEGLGDVTPQQGNALLILFQERRPMTARRLAQAMVLSEVTVGRFVKALEAAGWVERVRDPKDARARLLRPTERAYQMLPRFVHVANRAQDEAFAGLPEESIAALARLTSWICTNLEAREEATDGAQRPSPRP
jgi:DNA-binding MarR family transcriptional regulator